MIEIGLDEIKYEFFYHGYSDSMTDWIGDHCKMIPKQGNYYMYNITKGQTKYLPYIKIKADLITPDKYPEYFL